VEFANVNGFDYIAAIIGACILCIGLMPVGIAMANHLKLLDQPSWRKHHSKAVPLVGGITIFVVFVVCATVSQSGGNLSILCWLLLVLIVGVADDHYDLSQKSRLFVHTLIILGIALTDGHLVYSIGSILGETSSVSFVFPIAVLFTIIAVIGAVNAVNMIDGVDGLLGTLAVISMVALLVVGL